MIARIVAALKARPSLLAGVAAGVVVFAASLLVDLRWATRAIAAWDLGILVTMALWLAVMARPAAVQDIARRAAQLDEGRGAILFLSVFAAVAALAAVGVEITQAKQDPAQWRGLRVGASVLTVALSWAFVHLNFALHYAHEFYGEAPTGKGKARRREGLKFPGEDPAPDYWDFLHFSMVIGVAAQTADVAIESRAIRRIVTWHGVIAFLFNTVILAVTINLASSLF